MKSLRQEIKKIYKFISKNYYPFKRITNKEKCVKDTLLINKESNLKGQAKINSNYKPPRKRIDKILKIPTS
jgi:hypothetical protein